MLFNAFVNDNVPLYWRERDLPEKCKEPVEGLKKKFMEWETNCPVFLGLIAFPIFKLLQNPGHIYCHVLPTVNTIIKTQWEATNN